MRKIWIVDPANIEAMESIRDEISKIILKQKEMVTLLIFEEVFMNVVKYAYDETEFSRPLKIIFEYNDETCFFIFTDCGKAFNPILYISEPLNGQTIGGHGIRLIKELSTNIQYNRTIDGENILSIWI